MQQTNSNLHDPWFNQKLNTYDTSIFYNLPRIWIPPWKNPVRSFVFHSMSAAINTCNVPGRFLDQAAAGLPPFFELTKAHFSRWSLPWGLRSCILSCPWACSKTSWSRAIWPSSRQNQQISTEHNSDVRLGLGQWSGNTIFIFLWTCCNILSYELFMSSVHSRNTLILAGVQRMFQPLGPHWAPGSQARPQGPCDPRSLRSSDLFMVAMASSFCFSKRALEAW